MFKDPKYQTDADRNRLAIEKASTVFDPAVHLAECQTCHVPYVLFRVHKPESKAVGCWFAGCPTQGCLSKTLWFKWKKEELKQLGIKEPWLKVFCFPGFADEKSINLDLVPKIPGV